MKDRIIIALDTSSEDKALYWVDRFSDRVEWFKVGLQLWSAGVGISVANAIKKRGKKVFLDVKLHDIPNTVYQSALNIVDVGVDIFNVHAQGGIAMMRAAAKAAEQSTTKVIAVTVITSIQSNHTKIEELAYEAIEGNMDGWVVSGDDACFLRTIRSLQENIDGRYLIIVSPGIRPTWAQKNDQISIVTPKKAFDNGSDYIVIGRAVTADDNPDDALNRVIQEIPDYPDRKEITFDTHYIKKNHSVFKLW